MRYCIWHYVRDLTFNFHMCPRSKCTCTDNPTSLMVGSVLRYLTASWYMGNNFKKGDEKMNIQAYCDSRWVGCKDSRMSTTGVNIIPIRWNSARQSCISLSSAETEYNVLYTKTKERTCIRRLFWNIKFQIPYGPEALVPKFLSFLKMLQRCPSRSKKGATFERRILRSVTIISDF